MSSFNLVMCSWGVIRQMRAGEDEGMRLMFVGSCLNNRLWWRKFAFFGSRWALKPPWSAMTRSSSATIQSENLRRSMRSGWAFFFGGISWMATCAQTDFHMAVLVSSTGPMLCSSRSPFASESSWQSVQLCSMKGRAKFW